MNTMFDTLLQLPLFQGLAQEDLTCILGKVKLHFTKYKPGATILKVNTICDHFIFILKGEVASTTSSADASYSFTEFLQGPLLIEPQSMFGMNTHYASTYVAHDEVHAVSISKTFVLSELFKYEIFRLNYMNLISNRAQNLNKRLWGNTGNSLEERISNFILIHSEKPTGVKVLKIKMEDLAQIFNETRIGVSKSLNAMSEIGLLKLHRGEIRVLDAEQLL